MSRRFAAIAAGAALIALPGTAFGAASEKATCMGQLASNNDGPPGSKGAFASEVATNAERGVSSIVVPAARCEDRGLRPTPSGDSHFMTCLAPVRRQEAGARRRTTG